MDAYREYENKQKEFPFLHSVSTDPVPEPVPEAGPSVPSGSSDAKSGNSDVNLAPKVASEAIKSDPNYIPPFMDISRPSPFRQGGEGWSNVVQSQDDSPVTPEHQAPENRRRTAPKLRAGTGAGSARHGASLAQTPKELVRSGVSLGIILNKGSELCDHPDSDCLDVPKEEDNLRLAPQSKRQGKVQNLNIYKGFSINNP